MYLAISRMPKTLNEPQDRVLADGTVMLFGVIGDEFDGLSAAQVVEGIRGLGGPAEINVLINSPGGVVTDGLAIYHELATSSANVTVEIAGIAASMASAIAMAGDTVRMAKNALFMIHDPWNVAVGNADELRRAADLLDKFGVSLADIYAKRSGLDADQIQEMMSRDNGEGTWLTADEAKELGFVDEVIEPVEAAAFADLDVSALAKVPPALTRLIREGKNMPKELKAATATTPEGAAPAGEPAAKPSGPSTEPQAKATTEPTDVAAKVAEGVAAERKRSADIRALAARCGLDDKWVNEMIDGGVTLNEANAKALDAMVTRQSGEGGPSPFPSGAAITSDERDKWRAGMADWLVIKSGNARMIEKHTKKRPDAGEFRGFSLLDIARDTLHRDGINTRGMASLEIARMAIRGQGLGTRSDFPVLLENVMHKLLLAAYETAPDQWRSIAATGSVTDFRPHPRLRLGSLARLSSKLESGEFRQLHFPDAEKEAVQAATYGNIIGLTREAIVNDDVDGFSRLTTMLGRAAARSIEIDVFALLASNSGVGPNMNDGKALFHADHNNIASTAAAPSVDSLEAARILMAQQKDPDDNDYLNLRPDVWAGPIGKGAAVRVAVNAEFDFSAETSGNTAQYRKPNIVRDLISTIVDTPRLTGNRWYVFADPNVAPVIEVSFLDGQESPQIQIEEGFDYDGVRWRIMHDYGVGAVDYRGAVTNAGA